MVGKVAKEKGKAPKFSVSRAEEGGVFKKPLVFVLTEKRGRGDRVAIRGQHPVKKRSAASQRGRNASSAGKGKIEETLLEVT